MGLVEVGDSKLQSNPSTFTFQEFTFLWKLNFIPNFCNKTASLSVRSSVSDFFNPENIPLIFRDVILLETCYALT